MPDKGDGDRTALDAAVAKSVLARMSAGSRQEIVSRGTTVRLAPKECFVHYAEAPRCGLVVEGLMRAVRSSEDGRDLTLHWERPGAVMGLTTAVTGPAPATIQAVTGSVLRELSDPLIRELGRTDPTVGWAVAECATSMLRRAIDEVLLYAYGDLRTRIERRLLEFACKPPPGTALIAHLTQADLAEAVGAARPSVARVLKDLREEGSIRAVYGGVLILRPEALTRHPLAGVA